MKKKVKKQSPLTSLSRIIAKQQKQVDRLESAIQELLVYLPASILKDIRVVTQKPPEKPETEFEKTVAWTTNQVNQHLNGMTDKQRDSIVQQALGVKASDAGPGSPMTQYLNDNYGTIMSVKDINEVMVDAIAKAKEKFRVGDRKKSLEYVDKQLGALK